MYELISLFSHCAVLEERHLIIDHERFPPLVELSGRPLFSVRGMASVYYNEPWKFNVEYRDHVVACKMSRVGRV